MSDKIKVLSRIVTRARALGIELDPGDRATAANWGFVVESAFRREPEGPRREALSAINGMLSMLRDAQRAEAKAADDTVRPRESAMYASQAQRARSDIAAWLDRLDAENPATEIRDAD